MIMFGHRSCSTISARSGCQWSRKRRTKRGTSSGTNWWMAPRGSRCSASPLDVTVPVVTSTPTPRARKRSISGSTLESSPTLAACSQTSGPCGRAMRAMPRRSAIRPPCSLPRFNRRDSINGINGAAAADSSR